ncbi:MAG: ribonucleotide-diphosphate reductase subunit beta [Actinomycetota bacterium]
MDDPLEVTEKSETISYERLYRMWEDNSWSAVGIDFSVDALHWQSKLTDKQREAALWSYAMFLVGEEAVARTLTPVLDAAEGFPQSIFLTTQIVDEARHHVFFDRFMREVVGVGSDTASTLAAMQPYLTWGFKGVFGELDKVTEALRKKPKDKALLAQTVALYHFIVEGVLAVPGQHFIQRYVEKYEILPGFSEGIRNVSRDESRHVAFGVKMLGDLVRSSKDCRDAAIEMWDRVLPFAIGVFVPPGRDRAYAECFGFTIEEIYGFGLRSLETKLKRVGIDPTEVKLLARENRALPYEERAARAWQLIEAGVLGDDTREPVVTPQVFEILFDGMTRVMDLDVARSLGGPVQWDFPNAESWHIVVTNGHAEAKPGTAGAPALRLEIDAGDFAKIAVGRTDARWALLTRKLKIHGQLSAKTKLPKLFPDA